MPNQRNPFEQSTSQMAPGKPQNAPGGAKRRQAGPQPVQSMVPPPAQPGPFQPLPQIPSDDMGRPMGSSTGPMGDQGVDIQMLLQQLFGQQGR